jgi:hypothetical protein
MSDNIRLSWKKTTPILIRLATINDYSHHKYNIMNWCKSTIIYSVYSILSLYACLRDSRCVRKSFNTPVAVWTIAEGFCATVAQSVKTANLLVHTTHSQHNIIKLYCRRRRTTPFSNSESACALRRHGRNTILCVYVNTERVPIVCVCVCVCVCARVKCLGKSHRRLAELLLHNITPSHQCIYRYTRIRPQR